MLAGGGVVPAGGGNGDGAGGRQNVASSELVHPAAESTAAFVRMQVRHVALFPFADWHSFVSVAWHDRGGAGGRQNVASSELVHPAAESTAAFVRMQVRHVDVFPFADWHSFVSVAWHDDVAGVGAESAVGGASSSAASRVHHNTIVRRIWRDFCVSGLS